ncbi:DUF4230 domain-containing protein [Aquimarina hainanensis]|uniref:DUF4230 domain-containing protein n=1 Tax=Aquimarina hainanensis TaxID=1578017 RepID=A0ABW5N8P9_9FLAO|nr:DUF4230 domain-containing protein [Aquimarina sp. TRL1]QKX03855.1 DUF4230 domain-containing protein [Aquimarina sp. TRL1]
MRNFFLGIFLAAFIFISIQYFITRSDAQKTEIASSELILNQIQQVGKLIVTEGNFSEVITYKDAKKFYLDFLTAEKKAIVVVNAAVSISYDLKKIKHQILPETKTVIITEIPEAEININPTIDYHNLEEDFFNQFTASDHNIIRKKVHQQLQQKIKHSSLVKNASNRLISELQKIYILTNSLGWTLQYQKSPITNQEMIPSLLEL